MLKPESGRASSTRLDALPTSALVSLLTDGYLAGLCEYTVCQPVDMVATRRMLVTTAASKGSIIGDLLAISRESGVVGWIAGVTRASARGSKYAFSGGGGKGARLQRVHSCKRCTMRVVYEEMPLGRSCILMKYVNTAHPGIGTP